MPQSQLSGPRHHWLFTGATGRIGRMLMRHWSMSPMASRIVPQTRGTKGGFLTWDPQRSPLPAGTEAFSVLIAFAGVVPGPAADLAQNLPLAQATMEAALRAGIPRVLLTSSSAVYGLSAAGRAWREEDIPHPATPYGRAKQEMEAACDVWRARGLEVCCLRIGNVAGADALLLNAARGPIEIDRFADGEGPLRSYIGPATLARVLETLAAHPAPPPPVLNVAAPRSVRMSELARAAGAGWGWTPAPATAAQVITLDCMRLASLHPFAPEDSEAKEMVRQWMALRDSA